MRTFCGMTENETRAVSQPIVDSAGEIDNALEALVLAIHRNTTAIQQMMDAMDDKYQAVVAEREQAVGA